MPARAAVDPLAVLDQSARRASPRVRVGVGAAVVLFVLAVAVAAQGHVPRYPVVPAN